MGWFVQHETILKSTFSTPIQYRSWCLFSRWCIRKLQEKIRVRINVSNPDYGFLEGSIGHISMYQNFKRLFDIFIFSVGPKWCDKFSSKCIRAVDISRDNSLNVCSQCKPIYGRMYNLICFLAASTNPCFQHDPVCSMINRRRWRCGVYSYYSAN